MLPAYISSALSFRTLLIYLAFALEGPDIGQGVWVGVFRAFLSAHEPRPSVVLKSTNEKVV